MDMDFSNQYPGILYEEAGRGFLAERGKITYIAADGTKSTIGSARVFGSARRTFKPGEWNQFHLIARGNTLVHIVNGHVTAVCRRRPRIARWQGSSGSSSTPGRR